MPDIVTLYNIQPTIEAAAETILANAGISNVYTSRNSESRETPAVEIQYQVNNPNGHVKLSGSNQYFYDQFNGTLTATIVTDRAVNNVSHSLWSATVARLLADNIQWDTGSIMPYHAMLFAQVSAVQTTNVDNADMTQITINNVVGIRTNAWGF